MAWDGESVVVSCDKLASGGKNDVVDCEKTTDGGEETGCVKVDKLTSDEDAPKYGWLHAVDDDLPLLARLWRQQGGRGTDRIKARGPQMDQ